MSKGAGSASEDHQGHILSLRAPLSGQQCLPPQSMQRAPLQSHRGTAPCHASRDRSPDPGTAADNGSGRGSPEPSVVSAQDCGIPQLHPARCRPGEQGKAVPGPGFARSPGRLWHREPHGAPGLQASHTATGLTSATCPMPIKEEETHSFPAGNLHVPDLLPASPGMAQATAQPCSGRVVTEAHLPPSAAASGPQGPSNKSPELKEGGF